MCVYLYYVDKLINSSILKIIKWRGTQHCRFHDTQFFWCLGIQFCELRDMQYFGYRDIYHCGSYGIKHFCILQLYFAHLP